jgi:hypothetical protein
MKKILLILLTIITISANAQIVNRFRDSTWFAKGVQFDSTLVAKGLKISGVADTFVILQNSAGKFVRVGKNTFLSGVVVVGSGTVTDFIYTNGNGFTGTVTNSTTTPTLSIVADSIFKFASVKRVLDSITALRNIRKVDSIYKKSTNRDLTYFKINGTEYSFIDSIGSGGGSGGIDSIYYFRTFAQLKSAMSAHTLNRGASYQLTDFTTIYDQPDYHANGTPKDTVVTKTASIEHLVFIANSDSTFAEFVSSIEYPNDKIKFDWTFTSTEVMNAPAKGRISEREDDHFNRADYDSRKVLYLRYESSTGSSIYNSWKDNGEASQEFLTIDYNMSFHFVIKDSKITAGLLSKPFILPNIVATGDITAGVTIGSNCRNLTFIAGCTGSEIGDFVSNLTSNSAFNYNYIGGGSNNMSFGGYVNESWLTNIDSLTIVGICDNSYIGSCLNSTFGGDFIGNSIWDRMVYCTFGDNFNYNIQYGTMYNCNGGTSFIQNVLYGENNNLTIGNNSYKCKWWGSSDNIIGDNNINVDFSNITNLSASNELSNLKSIVFSSGIDASGWVNFITVALHPEMYDAYPKTVIKTPNGNVYTRYLNNSLTDVITIID